MKKRQRMRRPNVAGICGDAKRLGVTRQHLRLVLQGHRESKPLIQKYRALQRVKRQSAGAT